MSRGTKIVNLNFFIYRLADTEENNRIVATFFSIFDFLTPPDFVAWP